MDEISKQYRHKQWALAIHEQKQSGLPIDEWCRQNGLSRYQFYYRQREVRKTFAQAATRELAGQDALECPTFAEIKPGRRLAVSPDADSIAAVIHTAGTEILLTNAASDELIRSILKALQPC